MTLYEDEIDLKPYILSVLHLWWLIALIAALFAGAAYLFSRNQPDQFEAIANALVVRNRSQLSLADRFPTVNEPVDSTARMNTLLSIAQSDAVALNVLQRLSEDYYPEAGSLGSLKRKVTITTEGDGIQFSAIAATPGMAAEIANAWAEQTVQEINQAYSGVQPLNKIQEQRQAAEDQYHVAQVAYEDFINISQIPILQNQLEEANILYATLAGERSNQITVFSRHLRSMDELLVQAETLKRQLEQGNRSEAGDIGDAIAVLMARASAIGIQVNPSPVQVQRSIFESNPENEPAQNQIAPFPENEGINLSLQVNELETLRDTSENYVADLDAIIQLSEQEKSRMQEALQALTQELLTEEVGEESTAVAARIQHLTAQLEKEQARQKELSNQRDLTWSAFQAISQKETEIQNSGGTTNQVNLASQAVPPEQPISKNTFRNTLIAGLIGSSLVILLIIILKWWSLAKIASPEHQPAEA